MVDFYNYIQLVSILNRWRVFNRRQGDRQNIKQNTLNIVIG